jgi:hypothetical protein
MKSRHAQPPARAVRFYRMLGFVTVHGGEEAAFTGFRAGRSYLNLVAQSAERAWSWWGRVFFYHSDVDALHASAIAAGCRVLGSLKLAQSLTDLADICARSFKLRFQLKLSVVQAGDFGFQFGNGRSGQVDLRHVRFLAVIASSRRAPSAPPR